MPIMTSEQFYAIVHKLRLTPTNIQNVFRNTAVRLIKQCGRPLDEFEGFSN